MDTPADTPPTGGGQAAGHLSVTPTQAAAALGVSERTVRRRIAKGTLPSGWTVTDGPEGLRVVMPDIMPDIVPDTMAADAGQVSALGGQTPTGADTESDILWERIAALESQLAQAAADLETTVRELAAARERETWLRERVEKAEVDRDRADEERRELVARVPLALPAAPERRGFWRRLFGGGADRGR